MIMGVVVPAMVAGQDKIHDICSCGLSAYYNTTTRAPLVQSLIESAVTGPRILSLQAEFSVKAGEVALERAGRCGEDLDMVLLAAGKIERAYPAVAMEVQEA